MSESRSRSSEPDPVLGASRGDRAFESFFRDTFEDTLRWLAQRTDPDVARDAVQEAYIKAYERWWRLRVHPKRTEWVRRAALREWMRSERRDTRRSAAEQSRGDVADGSVDDIAWLETSSAVHELLDALPEQQRRAMVLSHMYQMTSAEGAEVMGISPGTFRFHLHEARRTMRVRLERLRTIR